MKSDRSRIGLILLGLALTASLLLAQAKKSPDQPRRTVFPERVSWAGFDTRQLLQEIDADRDGVITRDEWERFFQDHDDNKDGHLTAEEMQPAGRQGESDEAVNPDYARETAFHRLDANKDDVMKRNEWPGNDRLFKRMDANRDGVISLEEFLSRNGRYWNVLFEDLDFNGDGIITRNEWLDSEVAFRRLDHDRNGVIDRFEFYTPK
jgi:Ca2+-binding EF-hand superfamily protein